MAKKTTKGFGELAELAKDFVKEIKEQGKEAKEEAVESVFGLKSSGKSKEEEQREIRKLENADNKKRGPEIARQRQVLALQAEGQRAVQQGQQDRREANLEEERLRQAEKGKRPPVNIPAGKKKASILPFRQKASTQEYIPQTAERIKRKAA